jgi:predicted anti-sigma-YlaC factor YlaD
MLGHHLSADVLAGYRQQLLEPAQLLDIDEHITWCSGCRDLLCRMSPYDEALTSLRASLTILFPIDDHPSPDVFLAHMEGGLDSVDRELLESHLDMCHPCQCHLEEMSLSDPAS